MSSHIDASLIGTRIKGARESMDLSQSALAKRLNVDQSTVALWEKGETMPRLTSISTVADELSMTPEFLLFGIVQDRHLAAARARQGGGISVGWGSPVQGG